jgi:hypothetical protein
MSSCSILKFWPKMIDSNRTPQASARFSVDDDAIRPDPTWGWEEMDLKSYCIWLHLTGYIWIYFVAMYMMYPTSKWRGFAGGWYQSPLVWEKHKSCPGRRFAPCIEANHTSAAECLMKFIWVEDGVSVTIGVSLGTHGPTAMGPSENIGQVMTLVISAKRTDIFEAWDQKLVRDTRPQSAISVFLFLWNEIPMLGDAINPKFAGDSVPSFDESLPILFMIKSLRSPITFEEIVVQLLTSPITPQSCNTHHYIYI